MRNDRPPGLGVPDVQQALALYAALMERLAVASPAAADEARLQSSLDRAQQMAEQQRVDIVTLASSLLFGLIKDRPFGPQSAQAGMAITLAFLARNGLAVDVADEELVGVGRAIAQGEVYTAMVEMWLRDSLRRVR